MQTLFFPWNAFVPRLTGTFNLPPVGGAPARYYLDVPAGGAWLALVFTSDASNNDVGLQSGVVTVTCPPPSSSQTPTPSPTPSPSPAVRNLEFSMCTSNGQSAYASPIDLAAGDVARVQTQAGTVYRANSYCVLTFRAASPLCGLNFQPLSFSFEDGYDFFNAYNFTAPAAGTYLATLYNRRLYFRGCNAFVPQLTGSYNSVGGAGAKYSLDVPAGGAWLALVFTSDSGVNDAGLRSGVVSVTCPPPSPSRTPSPTPSPSPAAARNLTFAMCDGVGQSAYSAASPVDLSEGDVARVQTQAGASYNASSSCALTFRAASPLCGLNFKPLSFSFEEGFDFFSAYNFTAPAAGTLMQTLFFPWNAFVPRLTGTYNFPPVGGARARYSLDVSAGGAWLALVFTSDASNNDAGLFSGVVRVTCPPPSPSRTPSPTPSPSPAAARNLTFAMCDGVGQSAYSAASPVELSVGDVARVQTQAGASYNASSSCALTFRAASPLCGLAFQPLSFSFEDGFDFFNAYNFTAPAAGTHLETLFFPWNAFVPQLTGAYNFPPVGGARARYTLDVPAGGAWLSLVFTSDASNNDAGLQSGVVTVTCTPPSPSRTPTPSATPSRSSSPGVYRGVALSLRVANVDSSEFSAAYKRANWEGAVYSFLCNNAFVYDGVQRVAITSVMDAGTFAVEFRATGYRALRDAAGDGAAPAPGPGSAAPGSAVARALSPYGAIVNLTVTVPDYATANAVIEAVTNPCLDFVHFMSFMGVVSHYAPPSLAVAPGPPFTVVPPASTSSSSDAANPTAGAIAGIVVAVLVVVMCIVRGCRAAGDDNLENSRTPVPYGGVSGETRAGSGTDSGARAARPAGHDFLIVNPGMVPRAPPGMAPPRPAEAAPRKPAARSARSDETECPVCMENSRDLALSPCGHLLCSECGGNESITRCPICRARVVYRTRLFL